MQSVTHGNGESRMTDQELAPFDIIQGSAEKFNKIAHNNSINIEFTIESSFAVQQIYKNDKTLAAAKKNPTSLQYAMANVASVGLSLNPATAYAYLVPRDGAICLDISYRGLIKIATDTGSIMWAKADVVYDSDKFDYHGPARVPTHNANPFAKERGEVVGCYCIAKTCDNDYLIETMTEEEVQSIKAKSPSASSAYSPWNTFESEMRKKCVIKRASKTWPKTQRHERLDNAIEYINQAEGIDFQEPTEEDIRLMDDLLHERNGAAIANLRDGDAEKSLYWSKIQKTFAAKGQIGKHEKMVQEWMDEAIEYVSTVAVNIQENREDEIRVMEEYDGMNEHEKPLFWRVMSPDTTIDVENIIHGITT